MESPPAPAAAPPAAAAQVRGGSAADVRRVARFKLLLALRLLLAAVPALVASPSRVTWYLFAACLVAPALALFLAPRSRETESDRLRAQSSAGTAGFALFVGSCLYALIGVAGIVYGVLQARPDLAWTGVVLFAFLPADYALLRLGLRAVADDTPR